MRLFQLSTMKIENSELLATFPDANLYRYPEKNILMLQALSGFISHDDFKEVHFSVGNYIKLYKPDKYIFDKRSLRVFQEKSRRWYFLVWKTEMYKEGLRKIHKILPYDEIFRFQVEGVRADLDLDLKNKTAVYRDMEICYFEDVEDALLGFEGIVAGWQHSA